MGNRSRSRRRDMTLRSCFYNGKNTRHSHLLSKTKKCNINGVNMDSRGEYQWKVLWKNSSLWKVSKRLD